MPFRMNSFLIWFSLPIGLAIPLQADEAINSVNASTISVPVVVSTTPIPTTVIVSSPPVPSTVVTPVPVVVPVTPPVVTAPAMAPAVAISTPTSTSVSLVTSPFFYVVHPSEGMKLPPLSQVFVFGAAPRGSTVTINGQFVPLSPAGGYLTMVPVKPGDVLISALAHTLAGEWMVVTRHFTVANGFSPTSAKPFRIESGSITPSDESWLAPGDSLRVAFQGSPGGSADFSIVGVAAHVPMIEQGTTWTRAGANATDATGRGIYEGTYTIQPGDHAARNSVEVELKKDRAIVKQKAAGHLTIDPSMVPHMGVILDDTVAVRTSPDGGYDFFLYRGMRVRLVGHLGGQWHIRLSSIQSGWVKQSAIQELPLGAQAPQSLLTNMTVVHQVENTLVKIPLSDVLPYRVEQTLNPPRLTITLYGAADKTDLIKYDPLDPLIADVHWRQIAPDVCQVVINPTFSTWWGYDIRYEGTTMVVEVRKPWTAKTIRGMVIAIDPGHGGSDTGAVGVHLTLEKEANLQIARVVKDTLEKAGAQPFLTRDHDVDVALYDRARIAWSHNARLFISIHCNASGEGENPVWNNGFSTYFYQPQSQQLATNIHDEYVHTLGIPDHGLYYADLAVCRMTQMPAVLTEQAFIIVPDQEEKIFDTKFQHQIATAILNALKAFVAEP